jgi:hypothetical protein
MSTVPDEDTASVDPSVKRFLVPKLPETDIFGLPVKVTPRLSCGVNGSIGRDASYISTN